MKEFKFILPIAGSIYFITVIDDRVYLPPEDYHPVSVVMPLCEDIHTLSLDAKFLNIFLHF